MDEHKELDHWDPCKPSSPSLRKKKKKKGERNLSCRHAATTIDRSPPHCRALAVTHGSQLRLKVVHVEPCRIVYADPSSARAFLSAAVTSSAASSSTRSTTSSHIEHRSSKSAKPSRARPSTTRVAHAHPTQTAAPFPSTQNSTRASAFSSPREVDPTRSLLSEPIEHLGPIDLETWDISSQGLKRRNLDLRTSLLGKRDLAPDCLSVSSGYAIDQFVLGVPLGYRRPDFVPMGSLVVRVREHASSWAGAYKGKGKLASDQK
ncbi:hypothetical protein E5676_scaffold157G00600 [Cucumis melo var. makuwa]|uniref:Uncharacterized protein n=1 Tax=Cucumis melo var. makuwa TaxID=1194695 RepID=A0A5A7V0Z8_CUCMM|nr:hypothetical protein E6C27_scaffold455G00620 [Cucumis melo var. makuwa]TYK06276.1 hypothetical protein E5676_scaffold157G00600 [Cucumis melo var. makuwa]